MTRKEELEKIVKQLEQGRQLDQEHVDLQWIWEKSAGYPVDSSIVDKGWSSLAQRINQESVNTVVTKNKASNHSTVKADLPKLDFKVQRNTFNFKATFAIAASIILLVSSGIWFLNNIVPAEKEFIYQTEFQQVSVEKLPDGSVVHLNAGSSLSFAKEFGNNHRELKLEGEAFFYVEPNEKIPFIISTGNSKIRVVGTAFNVDGQIPGLKKISVVEGIVAVYFSGSELGQFKMGDEVLIDEVNHSYTVGHHGNAAAWLYNSFHFENESLHIVIEKLEKWYGVSFSYPSELADEKVTTTFDKAGPEKAAEILSKTLVSDIKVVN
jgi:transmembrane sensor